MSPIEVLTRLAMATRGIDPEAELKKRLQTPREVYAQSRRFISTSLASSSHAELPSMIVALKPESEWCTFVNKYSQGGRQENAFQRWYKVLLKWFKQCIVNLKWHIWTSGLRMFVSQEQAKVTWAQWWQHIRWNNNAGGNKVSSCSSDTWNVEMIMGFTFAKDAEVY